MGSTAAHVQIEVLVSLPGVLVFAFVGELSLHDDTCNSRAVVCPIWLDQEPESLLTQNVLGLGHKLVARSAQKSPRLLKQAPNGLGSTLQPVQPQGPEASSLKSQTAFFLS